MARAQKNQVPQRETYRVRGADGRIMPLDRVRLPDGSSLMADGAAAPQVFTPETVIEVKNCDFVQRRLRAGDMVLVEDEKPSKPSRGAGAK